MLFYIGWFILVGASITVNKYDMCIDYGGNAVKQNIRYYFKGVFVLIGTIGHSFDCGGSAVK